nr:hypothetical protein [Paraburkholderia sprentiae]
MGKRKAYIAAIRRSFGDLVLNVDADTIIGSDVVTKLALKKCKIQRSARPWVG